VYSGSLHDVSTFKTTMAEMNGITGGKKLVLVMDKGFYRKKNVEMMLGKYPESEFLINLRKLFQKLKFWNSLYLIF
jgi:transposase